jgi:tRNA A37 methylthiotransferase MiaB
MQQEISRDLLSREKGRVFDVLIEEDTGDGSQCVGRSYHFAPDVDGVFVVNKCVHPAPGGLIQARVSSTGEYDLFGEEVQAGGAQL